MFTWWNDLYQPGAAGFRAEPPHSPVCCVSLPWEAPLSRAVLFIYLCPTPKPVTGPASPPPWRMWLCPEASVQGGRGPSSGSDLAPLRAQRSSQAPTPLQPAAEPSCRLALWGTSLCLHARSHGNLSQLPGRLHGYLICSPMTSST